MKKRILLVVAMMLVSIPFIGCEETNVVAPTNQEEFCDAAWIAWAATQYDGALEYFGDALKIDNTYPDAHNGMGWTYARTAEYNNAFESFTLAQYLDPNFFDAYVGNSWVLMTMSYFDDSVLYGNYVVASVGDNYTFNRDTSVTSFDIYMVLALDYAGLGQAGNCCAQINNMRRLIGEAESFSSTNWTVIIAEIERLDGLDPS